MKDIPYTDPQYNEKTEALTTLNMPILWWFLISIMIVVVLTMAGIFVNYFVNSASEAEYIFMRRALLLVTAASALAHILRWIYRIHVKRKFPDLLDD